MPDPVPAADDPLPVPAAAATHTLSEAASKELLGRFGVPFPEERVAADPDAAVAAAEALGHPVVVKLNGDGIAHKTERGLVRLGLDDGDAVRRAATELLAAATPDDGEVTLLVAPMLRATRELIVGLSRDPQFGMTVAVGVGGVLAEAVADVSVRLVPVEREDVEEMLDDLRARALLHAFRGEPPVDRSQLVDLVLALSRAAVTHPEIVAADLNPVLIVGGEPIAVDALVEMTGPEAATA